MFDYQAGEKYRLTLIMVGLAGVMAGIFFTVLLMPPAEPPHHRQRQKWENNPDVVGRGDPSATRHRAEGYGPTGGQPQAQPVTSPPADPNQALTLVREWLPKAWDLSAGSAATSQEQAILYMTPECAAQYRQNVWTPDIAKQIESSGLRTTFQADKISASTTQDDGSVIVFVDGEQVMQIPSTGSTKTRSVKLEYMIRQTGQGLKISGISEGG